jgi:predicted dehydrogenase
MVGGGPGAFIGAVHRHAAALDGEIELVAGAFSSSAERSREQGRALFLDRDRVYGSYSEMVEAELAIDPSERIDFVSIVTPNHNHFEIAKAFISAGFHVVCDKPMTTTQEDAEALVSLVREKGVVFALTHNYTGYPMVKEARHVVRVGRLGEIRKIVVEYPQGWLATLVEGTGNRQAAWRTDPSKAGVSSSMGDIGSHAHNLAHYITGLEIESMCADLTSFVPGRELDDDGNVLLRYRGGARGILYASQVSVGEENNLAIRIYGTKAGLEWHQEDPNDLYLKYADRPGERLRRGNGYLGDAAKHYTRLPSGHPESFIEAFANIYRAAGRTILARSEGVEPNPLDVDFPTVVDGAAGVHFIHKTVESSRVGGWIDARYDRDPL